MVQILLNNVTLQYGSSLPSMIRPENNVGVSLSPEVAHLSITLCNFLGKRIHDYGTFY